VAIGTIGAVAYALFRDLVVTPRRRPKLELRFDRAGNDLVIVGTAGGVDAAHVRLRVANGPGKDTADDVVVMVTELRPADSEDTRPIHLPLTWSGTSPPLTVSAVHPGSARHIDLLHLDMAGDDLAPLQLDVNPKPTGRQDFLEPGSFEISIEIRGRNADALRYVVPVSWDGHRSDRAAMWDHLRVEPPRRVP
jgi:hypothetical protein